MEITDITIRKIVNNETPMKAIVSVTLDDQLALHDIKVIYARDKYFVVMPSRKKRDGSYRDVAHPITSSFRAELEDKVISAYHAKVSESEGPELMPEFESFDLF